MKFHNSVIIPCINGKEVFILSVFPAKRFTGAVVAGRFPRLVALQQPEQFVSGEQYRHQQD
jgi:hypothetical protein